MYRKFKVSVRDFVEMVFLSGDIDSRFSTNKSALDGARLHRKIQKEAGSNYISEYSLSFDVKKDNIELSISGRADGIVLPQKLGEEVFIDEIKTTRKDLSEIEVKEVHLAQGKIYGYIYAIEEGLDEIGVRITYCNVKSEDLKFFDHMYTIEELEVFFDMVFEEYIRRLKILVAWIDKRNASIKVLDFPFSTYRKNQRELAVATYRSLDEGRKLFLQAPTGIGKTISTIFASLKLLEKKSLNKVFYLTAKTTVRAVAEDNLKLLINKGADLKFVSLTAKDKICFMERTNCTPEYCSYARGYYDRLRSVIERSTSDNNIFDRDNVERIAKEENMCPFELQLDLSYDCDVVVGDYNYLFDPNASLRRFFAKESDSEKEYIFLIDEAHNLPDRAREMYSIEITNDGLNQLRKDFKDNDDVYKGITKLISMFKDIENEFLDDEIVMSIGKKLPAKGFDKAGQFLNYVEEYLAENNKEERHDALLNVYFEVLMLRKIEEIYDGGYKFWVRKNGKELVIRLFCLDPSDLITFYTNKAYGTVFFSATMAPMNYFKSLLGHSEKDRVLMLGSPFDKEKRLVMLAKDVKTKYRQRQGSYELIAEYIHLLIKGKIGNYMIFFPSYKYMEDVFFSYESLYCDEDQSIIMKQDNFMSEVEREAFLVRLDKDNKETHIAFCVSGGVFSEGIDLKGDRLIGVGIVGVGLPQICDERQIISDYFKDKDLGGFDYAYVYPGINKVLQSVGRLIRTETDKGVVLLMDERYNELEYQKLLPPEMFPIHRVDRKNIEKEIESFWNK